MHCPRCGNDWGYLSLRKDGTIKCCNHREWKSCNITFNKNQARMYSNTHFRNMIKWCFGE